MIKAVIFDCDGVIVDSETLRFRSIKELFLKEFGIKLPKRMERGRVGMDDNIPYYLKKYDVVANVSKIVEKRKKILYNIFKKKRNVIPIEGIEDLVELSRNQGYKTAVATGSSMGYLKIVLNSLDLTKKFDELITGEMVKRGKPDPEIFLLAAKKLNVKPRECVAIEDTLSGVKAAINSGMKCIAITSTFSMEKLKRAGADMVINSLKEINVKKIMKL